MVFIIGNCQSLSWCASEGLVVMMYSCNEYKWETNVAELKQKA